MFSNHLTPRRLIIAVLALAGLCLGIRNATRIGLARTLGEYANGQRQDKVHDLTRRLAGVADQSGAADKAVTLAPADAETHYARGDFLQLTDDPQQAQVEFERAVQLRPRDYYLWLVLGVIRDQNHDQEGAVRAMRQSVALAPSYSRSRWQLGNVLLRMGDMDGAFAELRQASAYEVELVPNVTDLAWSIYHDAPTVVKVVQPAADASHMSLAFFFARHDRTAAAAEQFLLIRAPSEGVTSQLIVELLKVNAFADAYQVWAHAHGVSPAGAIGVVRDGGFESSIPVGQPGFGWQITADVANVTMSIDESQKQSGGRSLRLDFRGNSNPAINVLTQLVLVQPQTRYRLKFAAQSKDFVSAALPIVIVIDAATAGPPLAQSPPFRSDVNGWHEFVLDFATAPQTHAILISLGRQACSDNPCPAFGTLWLDSFTIEPVNVPPANASSRATTKR